MTTSDAPTTVVLADDHPVFRRGMRELLLAAGGYDVVAEVEDGLSAVEAVHAHRPGLLVLDVGLPQLDGVEVTRRLVAGWRAARILVVTMHDDRHLADRCLDAGALGYVTKHTDPDDLLRAAAAVAAGQSILGASVASGSHHLRTPAELDALTAREQDVLALLATGLSNPAIARKLQLADKTVRNLVSTIFTKLGVNDRTSAALRYRDLTRDS